MSFLDTFFKKQEPSVLGIDIGSSSIKIVQMRKKAGKAVLETYGELALGPYAGIEIGRATNLPDDKIANALKDLFKEANVTTMVGGLSIATSASLLPFIHMPLMDGKQLAAMVPIEARKYIPVPITEVTLDWWPIPKQENSFSEFEKQPDGTNKPAETGTDILLVIIHNDVLNRLNQITQLANIQTRFYEIEIFSSMRAVVDQNIESIMVFDMGAGSTKLFIVERGILRASHTINRGSQDITLAISRSMGMSIGDAEHIKRTLGLSSEPENKNIKEIIELNLDYVFSETNRVISAFEHKHNKSVSKVVLTGGGSLLKGFLDLARVRFETEVVLANPFSKVEAPAFLEPVLKTAGPEFAVAIGLALKQLSDSE